MYILTDKEDVTVSRLNVCIPDWQSSGNRRTLYYGARFLRDQLADRLDFVDIEVEIDDDPVLKHGVIGHGDIVGQLARFRDAIDGADPESLFTVGGTCGIEVVPISYLNRRYDRDLAVVWFDAHADMNTPQSSPSKTFHGMPLRVLMGEGEDALRATAYSTLHPDQVILAGVRDLDSDEAATIERHGITRLSTEALTDPKSLAATIRAAGYHNLYLHIDFDVLDPASFPHTFVPTADGLSFTCLIDAVRHLVDNYEIVGASMVELAPKGAVPVTEVLGLLDALAL